jgi:aspartokinase
MAMIVKKFGGTSVGSIGLIKNIAEKIAAEKREQDSLVLVVSAMARPQTSCGLWHTLYRQGLIAGNGYAAHRG